MSTTPCVTVWYGGSSADSVPKITESVASVTFSPLASVSPVFPLSFPLRSLKTFESSVVTRMFRPATSVR